MAAVPTNAILHQLPDVFPLSPFYSFRRYVANHRSDFQTSAVVGQVNVLQDADGDLDETVGIGEEPISYPACLIILS